MGANQSGGLWATSATIGPRVKAVCVLRTDEEVAGARAYKWVELGESEDSSCSGSSTLDIPNLGSSLSRTRPTGVPSPTTLQIIVHSEGRLFGIVPGKLKIHITFSAHFSASASNNILTGLCHGHAFNPWPICLHHAPTVCSQTVCVCNRCPR